MIRIHLGTEGMGHIRIADTPDFGAGSRQPAGGTAFAAANPPTS